MNNKIIFPLLPISILVLFVACHTTKKIALSQNKSPLIASPTIEPTPIEDKAKSIFDYKKPRVLGNKLSANEFNFQWLNSKFSASTDVDGKSNSFNASVRAKKDSALWISISLFGIEGARMFATCDSVKFIDRINNKYFIGDYSFLSHTLNADIDFEMLQSILIGNSVAFYDEDEKLRSFIEEGDYVLSTIRKHKMKKAMRMTVDEVKKLDVVQRIWIEPKTFKIKKNIFNDLNTNRTFEGQYSNFQKVDSLLFPFELKFELNAQHKTIVNIKYSKVEINNPQVFPFTIPSKYEMMKKE